jgi:hypothetical protein
MHINTFTYSLPGQCPQENQMISINITHVLVRNLLFLSFSYETLICLVDVELEREIAQNLKKTVKT